MGADPVAFPVLAVHRDVVTIAVNPTSPDELADGWPEVEPIDGRRTFMVGTDGDLIDMVIDLGDGTSLTLGTATLTVAEMRAVADAVVLVDRAAWEARYAPMAPYRSPDPPATTAVPATDPPPSSSLAPAGLLELQERLTELGFDPGPADGVLGRQTEQAIWAAEKLYLGTPREQVTGLASDALIAALGREGGTDPRAPRRSVPDGTHVEIDLPSQVLIVYDRDQPVLVTHISTGELDESGEPAQWCETITIDTDAQGNPLPEPQQTPMCGISKTPGGIFDVDRLLPGTRIGPLGAMWNPIYFNFGLAIHGAFNVPTLPASHGAVRVPMEISEYLPDLIPVGTPIYVWDGVKEPEEQSREDELPAFGWPDPAAEP
jgi:lipoprotein-anchoring transpeptidase ErfK/SrfK